MDAKQSDETERYDILRHFTTFYDILRQLTTAYDSLRQFTTVYDSLRQLRTVRQNTTVHDREGGAPPPDSTFKLL